MTSTAEQSRRYREKNPERYREAYKRYEAKRRGTRKATHRAYLLNREYGLTVDKWEELFNSQGRVCAICKTDTPKGKHGIWYTDHNHLTSVVRGILCHNCNVGLGNLKADEGISVMNSAIEYIKRSDNGSA